jgi:LysM repeat protein
MLGQRKRPGQPLRPSFAGWRLGLAAILVLVAPIVVGFLLLAEFDVLIDDDTSTGQLGEFVADEAPDETQGESEPTFVLDDSELPRAEDVALQTEEPRREPESNADPETEAPTDPQPYIVVPGDTLASIAVRQGRTIFAIAAFNGIEDINRLDVGQRLQIPPASYVPPPPEDPDADDPDATSVTPLPPLPPGPIGDAPQ